MSSSASEYKDDTNLQSLVELQLCEVEMLHSMFPGNGELVIVDPSVLYDLKQFAAEESDSSSSSSSTKHLSPPPPPPPPPPLEFIINLDVQKGQLCMNVTFPQCYPSVHPSVFVRSQTLSREGQHHLNQSLLTFLKSIPPGDLCIGPAVTWLQEEAATFFKDAPPPPPPPPPLGEDDQPSLQTKCNKFVRVWIYSHHIYSKVKRKDILDLSSDFDLTGFCLPGKPGIICVEGLARNVDDWWHQVRSWNWQKIMCKKREEETLPSDGDLCSLRKFATFEELGSENNIRVKKGGHHVNMGDVLRYLEEHDSGYVFEHYFGINTTTTKSPSE